MLRIVAGRHRGRRFAAPEGSVTRPTAERVRQALFDMIRHAPWSPFAAAGGALEGARVLDAFAGTGALGIEALSRGALHASFIEADRAALAVLRRNLASLGEEARARVIPGDATRPPPADAPCSLVLLDPPYGRELVPRAVAALAAAGWIAPGALVVAELGEAEALSPPPTLTAVGERAHGAARLIFLRAA